ncbi:HD-GYP domain-containing protein [Crassaminicella thermophila]|uniref:HD-GYP domain-containing protein n=1 Tax=Crassaminicella thermophila TaxID=2599308 RepID=A0A5C0SB93_CRATE|nr:HD-GYP domain-containing protein [Crassaminicella thermophila]QEK11431.1 HD-GYP domain-containing protein [Crassaminicella thermophila]
MRLIPIGSAKEGMYLAQTLNDKNNRVLLQKGVKLNQNLIGKIKENGIYSIYINDEYSDNEIEDVISPKLRNEAIKTIKDTFDGLDKYFKQRENAIKVKQLEQEGEKNIQSLNNISKEFVDEILMNNNIVVNLVDIKSIDSYTYQHSVNVAVLSLILGIEMGLNRNELHDLCIGAMLHDIGKAFIPKEILLKKAPLTEEELDIEKDHTKKGYEYLKEKYEIKATTKVIALQHHERVDGSGFPYGYKGDKINKLARIVAIADTYDYLTSDTANKKAVPPNEAIELIMGSAGRYFDFKMVEVFAKKIMPYPEGSLVQLSNGEIGVVQEIQPDFPLRPKVKIVRQNAVSVEMKMIDLMKETNVVIKGILYEIPNACVPRKMGEGNSFKNTIR